RPDLDLGLRLSNEKGITTEPTDSSANPRIFFTVSSVGSRCHRWVFFLAVSPAKRLSASSELKLLRKD
ncbi:hypothetical protein, partial [Stieleria sp.]|uniref:hypothetical protein n=1 Tax=Stieleria sp. TaxID=2795976 RepID=UPI0035684F97